MSAAFTAPLIAGAIGLVALGDAHDASLDKLRTTTGKTGQELKALDDATLAVFGNIPTTLDDASTAVGTINQKLGLTGANLMNLSQQELELSRITGTDLAGNINSTAAAFNNWNVAAADQSKTLDEMFRASQATGIPVATLADELTQYGPILRSMGLGLDDSIALLADLNKAGVDAGTVVTGMRTAFKKFGADGVTDTSKALQDVFTQIQNAPDAIKAGQIAIDIFGSKAGPALADSIRGGKLSYQDLLATVASGTDTIVGVAYETNDWKENLQILRNFLAVKLIPIADWFFATLNSGIPYVQRLGWWIGGMIDRFNGLPKGIKQAIGMFLGFLAALGPVLILVARAIKIWGSLTAVFSEGGALAFLGPWLIPIALIAAAVIGLYFAWKHNLFGIQELTHRGVAAVVKFLTPLWHTLQQVGRFFDDVAHNRVQPFSKEMKALPGWIRPVAFVLARVIKTVRVFLKTWQDKGPLAAFRNLQFQIKAFGRAVASVFDKLGLKNTAAEIKRAFYDLAKTFNDVVTLVNDLVHGRWKTALHDLVPIAVDLLHLFIDRFRLIGALLIDIFNIIPWGTIGSALWRGLKASLQWIEDKGAPFAANRAVALFRSFKTAAGDYWDTTVGPWMGKLPRRILTAIGDLSEYLAPKGKAVIRGLANAAADFWTTTAGPWFSGLPGRIAGGIPGAIDILKWVGHDIMNGLWQGMVDVFDWILNNIGALLNRLPAAARKALGINSPSKVFAEVGKAIPEGMAVGIAKHAHLVTGALGKLNGTIAPRSSSIPALASAGGAAAASGSSGPRVNQFGPGAIVVKAGSVSREEANRLAVMILDRVDQLDAGAH